MGDFLIYGVTGYTGQLIAEHAVERGLNPVLAGRRAAADRLRLRHRVFGLESRKAPAARMLRRHNVGVGSAFRDALMLFAVTIAFRAQDVDTLKLLLTAAIGILVLVALHATWPKWSWEKRGR